MDVVLSELQDCLSDFVTIDQIIDEKILKTTIDSFLATQKKENRIIFVQRYWYLMSIRDISKIHHVSESKITSILYRMRNKLKEKMQREGHIL